MAPDPEKYKQLDTRSLRGLAHPLRVRILGLLRAEGPATSARLAKRLAEDSGNISWHLRQLANTGFITEETELGTRRERWWRAAHDYTRFDIGDFLDDPETRGPVRTLVREVIELDFQRALAYSGQAWPREWAEAAGFNSVLLRLTPTELKDLLAELLGTVGRYDADREPEGAGDVLIHIHGFPRPDEEEGPATAGSGT
ncbi:winged helix-turn-helix domain-containing protein [Amycolatopsis aidingensis]|uniref:winged helix-turn-helix domain-containing protein n=1 Tax=Amycolatopsis aidingensis TaxID=2842453 RepID=UPI001C0C2905|nr:helix-turn-helix domain-containing protein [Amycolatopsis aidingensis]